MALPDLAYTETILGFKGCHRMRWVGVDFGPANTAVVLVEIRGMPPQYDPRKAMQEQSRRIDALFKTATEGTDVTDQPTPSAKEPWVVILVAFKYNLKQGRHFMYVDPDFQREFDGFNLPRISPPKFASPFDARRAGTPSAEALPATADADAEAEEEDGRPRATPAKRKRRASPDDPGFPLYPRIEAIRVTNNDAHGGEYERCSRNWGKFLASQPMLWLFASRWPVVCENQVDHIAGGYKNKRREPYNWAESHSFITALAALDEVYSGHTESSKEGSTATQYPRLVCYVAGKYGLASMIEYRCPDYSKKSESDQKALRKSLSIEVLKSLPLRKEFFAWYSKLYAESNPGKPKQDDIADAALMAIAAVEKFYRPTKLGTVDKERQAELITETLGAEESRVAKDAASAPHADPDITPSFQLKKIVPSKKPRVEPGKGTPKRSSAAIEFSVVRGKSAVRGGGGVIPKTPRKLARETIQPIYTDDRGDEDAEERLLLTSVLAKRSVRSNPSSVVLYERATNGSVEVDHLGDLDEEGPRAASSRAFSSSKKYTKRFTGPSDDIHEPDYDMDDGW